MFVGGERISSSTITFVFDSTTTIHKVHISIAATVGEDLPNQTPSHRQSAAEASISLAALCQKSDKNEAIICVASINAYSRNANRQPNATFNTLMIDPPGHSGGVVHKGNYDGA